MAMTQTLTIGKRRFVLLPEIEYGRLRRDAMEYRRHAAEDRRLGLLGERRLRAYERSGRAGLTLQQVRGELGL